MKRKSFTGTNYNSIQKSTRTYYDQYSAEYVKFYENWSRDEGEFADPRYKEGYETVARILKETASPGEEVVDVGCGVGKWSILLAEKGVHITSADNLPSVIGKLAQTRKQHRAKSIISLMVSDGFYLPFRNQVFDGATLNWVLAHIPVKKSEHFMKEVSRVVKRRGWLFVSDSYWRDQKGGKEQIQTREIGGNQFDVYKYYYEPDELEQLFNKTFGKIEFLKLLHYELICVARKSA